MLSLVHGQKQCQGVQPAHAASMRSFAPDLTARERSLLRFQSAAGNHAVQRVMQRKLAINRPGDRYEQEADRIADQVMRMPAPQLQRACSCGGACASCSAGLEDTDEHVQTKRVDAHAMADATVPPIVDDVLTSPGKPLDAATRSYFEPRFGVDLSTVRVHTDARAAESARAVNALAYTVGRDVVFGSGGFAAGTPDRQHLLADELAHVMQQSTMRPSGVVQRQAGGGGAAGGAAPGGHPAGFHVKYTGCARAPYTQPLVEAAALAAYNKVTGTNCIRSRELRDDILSEFAHLTVECEQGNASSPCGQAWRFFSHTVHIYPPALAGATCGPLESTILHEAVHLTELRLIEHGDLAGACEASCFGFGSGDPAKCNAETLVRHGPRFAVGLPSGPGGHGAFGRVGYEVIRSWTGTAFSLGVRLDVPLTDRDSFVRAGLEIGSNFQLLGSLYGRLYGGLSVPLPPGTAQPSTFVGTGLGFDFGRTQLEVLYEGLDLLSKEDRTHELLLGVGFRFGKH
jgi:hypothetical protein